MWAESWSLTIPDMTRADAENRAAELNREHPERARYRWMAHQAGEAWEVVRMAIPGAIRLDPLTTTTEARPQPAPADDPRTSFDRNVGGPWVGPI
jgi:hypothetical protein